MQPGRSRQAGRVEEQRVIKRRGWAFIVCAAFCLLIGLSFGKQEFFILAAIAGLLLLIALAQAAWQRPRLKLDIGRNQVVCGQAKEITVIVQNNLPWPLFPVRLRLSLLRDNQQPLELSRQEILLKGKEEISMHIQAICPHRGEYGVLLHQYFAEDVFGLFALPGLKLPPQSLLSLPKLDLSEQAEHKLAAREEEESQQGRPGMQGQLTAESRLYQLGDALHGIHWQKSASRRTLFSRLHENSADYSCCMLVDTQPWGQGEEALAYEDTLCEAALSFLFSQLTRNRALTLLPGDLRLQALPGLDKAAALLAALPFDAGATLAALEALLASHNVPDTLFLLLGQPQPQLAGELEQLMNLGCAVVCLAPAAYAEAVENSLALPIPMISIEPPFMAANWLEV